MLFWSIRGKESWARAGSGTGLSGGERVYTLLPAPAQSTGKGTSSKANTACPLTLSCRDKVLHARECFPAPGQRCRFWGLEEPELCSSCRRELGQTPARCQVPEGRCGSFPGPPEEMAVRALDDGNALSHFLQAASPGLRCGQLGFF